MIIKLEKFEKKLVNRGKDKNMGLSDDEINEKYEKGETRIVTEQGAIKLSLVKNVFKATNYQLRPQFQRRITWDEIKRSKLIESFIMNVPVPPVFVYETEFDKYQVMDGLQRISTIIDFYDDKYELVGLNQWPELNGRKYSKLPQKIKEGIDRRQLSVITLLKESSKSLEQEEEMKKMVFERLNTGGVALEDQEIRNALYDGAFNELCIRLSEDLIFRELWQITSDVTFDGKKKNMNELDDAVVYAKNRLYRRMYDVEIVLRYFAMRHVEEYSGNLSDFLDLCLREGNKYKEEELEVLERIFKENIRKAKCLFGQYAFCQYTEIRNSKKWTSPQKMIYDCMMLALTETEVDLKKRYDIESNIEKLKRFYEDNDDKFNGKKQSKKDIIERTKMFSKLLKKILGN